VGQPTVAPLRTEEMLNLAERSIRIVVGEPDRDEGGIPAPLMRIQARGRFCPTTDVVPTKDGASFVA
jgi:hypothetical protein